MKRRSFIKLSLTAGAGLSSGIIGKNTILNQADAAALAPNLSDPTIQPMFQQFVINAIDTGFIYRAHDDHEHDDTKDDDDDHEHDHHHHKEYSIKIQQSTQLTGLVNSNGVPVSTTFWGYKGKDDQPTWPGKTFEVRSFEKTKVKWKNKLRDGFGSPLPHLLAVDESLHWCYSIHGYQNISIATDGVPLVPHLHGGHTSPESDGNPEYFEGLTDASRGPRYVSSTYKYENSQSAGTLWYHDHALGITRLNVYAGLAGMYIIRDDKDTGQIDNPLNLPAAPYELGYVIQDKMFTENGDLFFPAYSGDPAWDDFIVGEGATPPIPGGPSALAEFFGDHIVVNGKIWPKASVEPRHYRVRLLNACDSRFLRLRLRAVPSGAIDFSNASSPLPFYIIGTDQGLLAKTVSITEIDIMPGERQDLVIDFSQVALGSRIIVENILGDAPFGGDLPAPEDLFTNRRTDRIMAFDVELAFDQQRADNFSPLIDGYIPNSKPVDKIRKLALFEGKDEYGRLMPMLGTAEPVVDVAGNIVTGSMTWAQPITENPALGTTEIWEIYNATGDAHPIHVHLVHFDILDRSNFTADVIEQPVVQHNGAVGIGFRLENIAIDSTSTTPASPAENGPKDMVMALPGQVTRIKMTFDKAGRYVWHCHILSHEDHEMMRAFHVGPI